MSGLSTADLSEAIKSFLIEKEDDATDLAANSFMFALAQALWEYQQLSLEDKDGGEKAFKFVIGFVKDLKEEIEGGLVI